VAFQDMEGAEAWITRVEQILHKWIIQKMLAGNTSASSDEAGKRAALFRSLGRGWIFIQIVEKTSKWKWWFENIDRVLRNRQHEIKTEIRLADELQQKYIYGYKCDSELVFVTRITRKATISIQKWAADYILTDRWASNQQQQKALLTPFPDDAERAAHAEGVKKRQKRKQRKRAAAMAASQQAEEEPAQQVDAPTLMQQSNDELSDYFPN